MCCTSTSFLKELLLCCRNNTYVTSLIRLCISMLKIETLDSALALYRGGHNSGFCNISDNHLLCENHIMSESTPFLWRQENEFPSMPFCPSLALNCMRTNLFRQRSLSVNRNWISGLKLRKLKENWAFVNLFIEFLITLSLLLCNGQSMFP